MDPRQLRGRGYIQSHAYRTAGPGADKPGARAGSREPPHRSHAAKRQHQKHRHVQVATHEDHKHEAVQAAKANTLDQRLGLARPHTTGRLFRKRRKEAEIAFLKAE